LQAVEFLVEAGFRSDELLLRCWPLAEGKAGIMVTCVSWEPVIRAIAAAMFIVIHTLIAALFIVCMYGIEELIRYLWATHEPLLFGRLLLAYVFHATDLGVLGAFGYRGVLSAYRAFEE
jgi:hypothetical protein